MSEEVRQYLRQPTFDCHQWEDEEILLLLQQMYLDLDLTAKFCIELPTLRNFLYEVYKNYNEVPFHNFRHCFCVAQMVSELCAFVTSVLPNIRPRWPVAGMVLQNRIFLNDELH